MKVTDFLEFCALPEGTIFSYYCPGNCSGLFRKGETIFHDGSPIDFFETSIVPSCWNGDPPTVDRLMTRWGLYEYDQKFAVLEAPDIQVAQSLLVGENR